MNSKPDSESECGNICYTIAIIGDKWSGRIVRELVGGPKRFTELEQALHIGPRTLSQRLDSLQETGIITKKTFAEAPPRTEYSLTTKGKDLLPVLRSMAEWGRKYC